MLFAAFCVFSIWTLASGIWCTHASRQLDRAYTEAESMPDWEAVAHLQRALDKWGDKGEPLWSSAHPISLVMRLFH